MTHGDPRLRGDDKWEAGMTCGRSEGKAFPSPYALRFTLVARAARDFPSAETPYRTSRMPRGCAWRQSTVRGRGNCR